MRKLEEVFSETKELYGRIDRLLKLPTYDQYDDLSGQDIDYKDGEQLFLLEEMQAIMKNLDDVRRRLKYLSLPVREVSRLHREMGNAREEMDKPFLQEKELEEKSARLAELNTALDHEEERSGEEKGKDGAQETVRQAQDGQGRPGGKPSILKALKEYEPPAPEKPGTGRKIEREAAV